MELKMPHRTLFIATLIIYSLIVTATSISAAEHNHDHHKQMDHTTHHVSITEVPNDDKLSDNASVIVRDDGHSDTSREYGDGHTTHGDHGHALHDDHAKSLETNYGKSIGSANYDAGSFHMNHGNHVDHSEEIMFLDQAASQGNTLLKADVIKVNHGDHDSSHKDHDMDNMGHMHMDHMNRSGMHGMMMWFHSGVEETVLFKEWKITTVGGMIGSVIGIILLAMFYEGLKYFREYLFKQYISSMQFSTVAVTGESGKITQVHKVEKHRMMSWAHGIQTCLHVIQIVMSYFLMLIFMTYNVWLCIAVVVGAGLGYFIFGWKKATVVDITEHCH